MTRIALVVAYLASIATAVVLLNATGNNLLAFAIWATASVILGLGTGQLGLALLAFWRCPLRFPSAIRTIPPKASRL